MKFLLRLAYLTAHAKSFWQNFWTCYAFLRNSLFVSPPSSERNTVCLSPMTSFKGQKPIRISRKVLSQVTRLGLRIWSENETSICVMEVARVSRTEESASDAFQSESHADFFSNVGDCSQRIRPRRSNSESTLICWGSVATETHHLSQRGQRKCNPARGVCLHHKMHTRTQFTRFRFFKANNDSPAGHKPLYPLTWVTLGCLPILKWH